MAIGNYSHAKLLSLIKQQGGSGTGDITGVTAGNGLSGGGSSGGVTLAVDINGATDGTGITVSDTDFVLLADADDSNSVKKVYVHQLTASNEEPAGANTQVQFNNNGAFGASANFIYDGSSLKVVGNISGSSTLQAVGATTLGSTLNVSGSALFADAITGTSFSGSSTLQAVGNTFLGGTLNVSGAATLAGGVTSLAVSDLTQGRVVFAGASGELSDDAGFLFLPGATGGLAVTNLSGSGFGHMEGGFSTSGNLLVTGSLVSRVLNTGRIPYVGSDNNLQDSANLTFDGSALEVVGSISGSSTLQAVGATTLGSTLNVSGSALFADAIAGTSFSGSSTLQAVGNTFLGADLNVTGNITNAALTNDRVLIAGTNGVIEDSNRLTFDNSTLKVIGNISGSSTLQAVGNTFLGADLNVTGNITNASLTNDRVLIAGTNGVIEDSNRLTFDNLTLKVIGGISGSSTLQSVGNAFLGADLNVTGNITNAALTNDRVLIAGANGVIEDSNRLTFDNSTLKVVGGISGSSTLEVVGGTTIGQTLHVSGAAVLAGGVTSLAVSDLTQGRVVFAGASGELSDDAGLRFDPTSGLSGSAFGYFAGGVQCSGDIAATGSLVSKNLTDNRVCIVGSNNQIEDSANLTFNGSTLQVVGQASASSNILVGGAVVLGTGVLTSGIGGSDGAPVFGIPSSGNGQFQNNLFIKDDKKIYFGDTGESFIEYNEDGDDFMTISGSSQGIVLSGSTIQIAGTLEGSSPLKIGGEIQFVGSEGESTAFNFGPNQEAKIFYENSERDILVISGSHTAGTVISGSGLFVDKFVGVGVGEGNATHAITLPDNSDNSGKMQANAYLTYSSIRYKKDVEPLEDPLGTLNKLDGVSYVWKDTGKKDYGFIAEEVGKVLPDIVEFAQDSEYANSMDYIRIISFLVEGVKAQDKKIANLEKKLDFLIEKLDK